MIPRVAKRILRSQRTMVLTGAGISTESGIPDFRSPQGIYSQNRDAQRILSNQMLSTDPQGFWAFWTEMTGPMAVAEPNQAHSVLARWEQEGIIAGVITQNIDGLHQKAGSRSVWEVHGNWQGSHCLDCGQVGAGEWNCPCGGWMRPDVVLFGDPMPDDFHEAWEMVGQADLLLVIGSSLQVAPVCYLPSHCPGDVVLINLQPTPLDGEAVAVIRGRASQVLVELDRVVHRSVTR